MKKKSFLLLMLFAIANVTQAQWEADKRLTNNSAISFTEGTSQRNIASSGDYVHVVWQEARDGNNEIYYKRSTDGGVNWGADTRLTNQFSASTNPSISVSGSVVHVVWKDNRDGNDEIYYKRSTDNGATWETDKRLTNAADNSYTPCVSASGSAISIVWFDKRDGNFEIYFKRSTDAGVNWDADKRLTNDTAKSIFPSVAVSGSTINVVWSEYRNTDEEIYYKRSTDGGVTWGADIRLTNSAGFSDWPCIAASGLNVHVVWNDFRTGGVTQAYYKRSADGGITWGADKQLSSNESYYASVTASGSVAHAIWSDNYSEIHYKKSIDGGLNWGIEQQITNSAMIFGPTLAISGSVVHMVWNDYRDGANGEMYYKRNPTGNNTTGVNDLKMAESEISVYPNPANANICVNFSPENTFNYSIKIINTLGVSVCEIDDISQLGKKNSINIATCNLTPGVYYLTLIAGINTKTVKFVIIR